MTRGFASTKIDAFPVSSPKQILLGAFLFFCYNPLCMTPEERGILEETLAVSQENYKILKSIQRSARIGQVMQIIYWLLIIGASVGAYYFVQPYLEQLLSAYSGFQDGAAKVNSFFQ